MLDDKKESGSTLQIDPPLLRTYRYKNVTFLDRPRLLGWYINNNVVSSWSTRILHSFYVKGVIKVHSSWFPLTLTESVDEPREGSIYDVRGSPLLIYVSLLLWHV